MAKKIPKRLRIEPLIESVFEIRFSSSFTSVSSLLPGFVFKEFPNEVASTVMLPAASILPPLREAEANLKYAPIVQVSLDPGPYLIQIGDHVASLSCPRPYAGWNAFGKKIRKFASVFKKTGLITQPERFSMKYVDILQTMGAPTIEPLDINIKLGGRDLASAPVSIRTEMTEGAFIHIVQVAASVNAQLLDNTQISGILIENDTIYNHSSGDFWDVLDKQLDHMHEVNKRRFFELLKDETLIRLEPEY